MYEAKNYVEDYNGLFVLYRNTHAWMIEEYFKVKCAPSNDY